MMLNISTDSFSICSSLPWISVLKYKTLYIASCGVVQSQLRYPSSVRERVRIESGNYRKMELDSAC